MNAYQMITATLTTLLLGSTAASATGLPSGVLDLSEAAELYVQKEVRCLNGYASVAIRTRDSIEHVSYAPVQAQTGTEVTPLLVTCGDDGYRLNGKKLTSIELTDYALATWRQPGAAKK
jgi:hypothetical protein